jgi:hypothetical protein
MTTFVIPNTGLRAELLDRLRTGTADETGVQYEWGDNQVPPAAEKTNPALPYGILYDLPGTLTVEAIDGVQADGALNYQVTCVGAQPLDTGTLADRARTALCSTPFDDVDGLSVLRVESGGTPPITRVGALFQTAESFTVYVSRQTLDSGG